MVYSSLTKRRERLLICVVQPLAPDHLWGWPTLINHYQPNQTQREEITPCRSCSVRSNNSKILPKSPGIIHTHLETTRRLASLQHLQWAFLLARDWNWPVTSPSCPGAWRYEEGLPLALIVLNVWPARSCCLSAPPFPPVHGNNEPKTRFQIQTALICAMN